MQTPAGGFDAMVRTDSFRLGTRSFHVTVGVDLAQLIDTWRQPGNDMTVALRPAGSGDDDASAVEDGLTTGVDLSRISGDGLSNAPERIIVAHSLGPLQALQAQVDKWSLIVFAASAAVTLAVAIFTAGRLSRPLIDLAERTSSLDLDRLDVQFASERKDEVGSLTRLLGAMVGRLRTSTSRLREAERRAAVGELARQINHDIKNGLVPIRNVFQHMAEVHQNDPGGLVDVFAERRATVDSSIAYLENLASQYARLTPDRRASACDLNEIVQDAVQGMHVPDYCDLAVRSATDLPRVRGDRLAIRRIIENIVGNAVDSLEGRSGAVVLTTAHAPNGSDDSIVMTVRDTGKGMDEAELEHAFRDFHTTKQGGTGLGLSVVRRLVGDLGGSLRIDTEPGKGTTVSVVLPTATSRSNSR